MRRTLTALAVAALALGWTTACEPPPPPASFTVNVTGGATGDDANPGDGICETAPGNSVCTLDAAVQEGNALGRADIHVPPATQPYNPSVLTETTITGNLALFSTWNAAGNIQVQASQVHITTEGMLTLEQAGIRVTGTAVVDGGLTLHRSAFYGWLDISPGGVVTMVNSEGTGFGATEPVPESGAWVTNRGTFISRFSRFDRILGASSAALFHTLDDGATYLGASVAHRNGETSSDCLGTRPVSEGYNSLLGCGLDGPGDVDGSSGIPVNDVPPGAVGCGTAIVVDVNGDPRPSPSSSHPGHCNRGPWEG